MGIFKDFLFATCILSVSAYACGCGAITTPGATCWLDSDLSAEDWTCLWVMAENVTIECQGHSIKSVGTRDTYGIYSNQPFTTVKDCEISGFEKGVYFNGTANGTINSVYSHDNFREAIYINGGSGNRIIDSVGIYRPQGYPTSFDGIVIQSSFGNSIINTVAASTTSPGLRVRDSDRTLIANSTVTSEALALIISGSSNTIIARTAAKSQNNTALWLDNCTDSKIIETSAVSNRSIGMYVGSNSNRNSIINSSGSGREIGIYIFEGNSNSISDSNGTSVVDAGITVHLANNTRIDNSAAKSEYGTGLFINACNGTEISNSNANSTFGVGCQVAAGNKNTIIGSTMSSISNSSLKIYLSQKNRIQSSTMVSYNGSPLVFSDDEFYVTMGYGNASTGNVIVGNTFISKDGAHSHVIIAKPCFGNVFYWNNFTKTSELYVDDLNGNNSYNSSESGQNEGNVWANVIDGSIDLKGEAESIGYPGLYVGTLIYEDGSSMGKTNGAIDYAPLTKTAMPKKVQPVHDEPSKNDSIGTSRAQPTVQERGLLDEIACFLIRIFGGTC